jgi:hypothetical protein
VKHIGVQAVNGITVCCSVVITLWNRLGPSVMNCSNVRGSVVRSCEAYRSSGGEWWHSVWLCCNKVYIHVAAIRRLGLQHVSSTYHNTTTHIAAIHRLGIQSVSQLYHNTTTHCVASHRLYYNMYINFITTQPHTVPPFTA